MTLLIRKINVKFQLGQGSFGEGGFDTIELSGLRCQVGIERAGLPFMSQAVVRIYGMPQTLMNQLSTLGGNPVLTGRLNQMTVYAGDDTFGMTAIFQGIIQNGYQDYNAAPAVAFVAESLAGGLDLVKPAAATSYPGTADVATIMQNLAARMTPPLTVENSGVNIKLTTPYLCGTLIDQIRTVARAANINAEIHSGMLYIWPRNALRPVAPTTLSKDTGLVSYPSFNGAQMVGLRSEFLPTLSYGAEVIVQSTLQPASGSWYVSQMSHYLESLQPGGAWFTDMTVMSKLYFKNQPDY